MTDIRTDTVVVGGLQADGREAECDGSNFNKVCWKVDKSKELIHLCDIPPCGIGAKFRLCVIPQGFLITGGASKPLCMMFITSTSQWVRLQDLLEQRYGHGSICIKNVLYILGGYVGEEDMEYCDSVYSMVLKYGK